MPKNRSGEKKFGSSLFGFNKVDVNLYLESLIKSYNESLWEKENQISQLKKELDEYKTKVKQYKDELNEIGDTRTKIANAFIDAQKNAEQIIENARRNAIMEKHKLEAESEALREVIVDRKETLIRLREAAKNFGNDLEDIMNTRIRAFKEELDKSIDNSDERYIFENVKDIDNYTDNSIEDLNQYVGFETESYVKSSDEPDVDSEENDIISDTVSDDNEANADNSYTLEDNTYK